MATLLCYNLVMITAQTTRCPECGGECYEATDYQFDQENNHISSDSVWCCEKCEMTWYPRFLTAKR